jgi:membrane protein YqaA with SNARE-associated domain
MIRQAYDWTMRQAQSERAPAALGIVSFIESSFFPIPPDIMLVPMVIANRSKAWWYATIATVSSVLGGAFGYFIGSTLYESIGKPLLDFYGKGQSLETFSQWFNEWGVWIILAKGMTPFPYKVLTIAAGVAHMPFLEFMLASVAARAMRFYLVAGLLYYFGEPIRDFIEKRLTLVLTVSLILIIGGFVSVKYLF